MCFGAQKNHPIEMVLFIEMVLLSTHNICFGCEIRKIIFNNPLLSGGLPTIQLYYRNMNANVRTNKQQPKPRL